MTQQNVTATERLWTYDARARGAGRRPHAGYAVGGGHCRIRRLRPESRPALCHAAARRGRAADAGDAHDGPHLRAAAGAMRLPRPTGSSPRSVPRRPAARRLSPSAKFAGIARVYAGETLTGNRRVSRKYERRGSKFVTFRVSAFDAAGAVVASYDYTCNL